MSLLPPNLLFSSPPYHPSLPPSTTHSLNLIPLPRPLAPPTHLIPPPSIEHPAPNHQLTTNLNLPLYYPAHTRQIQVSPATRSAPKINIPRRGEKDFEPLTQTALIQEKMLRESRQALFDGLGGVRGGSRLVSFCLVFFILDA